MTVTKLYVVPHMTSHYDIVHNTVGRWVYPTGNYKFVNDNMCIEFCFIVQIAIKSFWGGIKGYNAQKRYMYVHEQDIEFFDIEYYRCEK